MIELRRDKGKTFLGTSPDGRKRWALGLFGGAVQFREHGGQWQDIDPSIEEADSEGFSIKFSKVPYLGRIGEDSHRRIYPDRTNLDCWIEFQKPYASMGTPTRSNRWFYWDFPNAIMGIRFDNTRVKFGFRLKNSSAPTSITIPFTTQGITRQGNLLCREVEGETIVIAELRKPIATDADDEERECEVSFGSGELTISLDTEGLTFPIDIDPTLDLDIGANLDDVHQVETGTVSDHAHAVIQVSNAAEASRNWGGFRWVSASLPAEGDTIDVAHMKLFTRTIYNRDDPNFNIHFEKAAFPAQFVVATNNVTARSRTDLSVEWAVDGVGPGYNQSPSLVDPLQEVIDDHSPTALVIITRPNQDEDKEYYASSYNYDPDEAAELHLEWTEASNTLLLQVAADLDDVHEKEDPGTVIDDATYVWHEANTAAGSRYWGAHRWVLGTSIPIGSTIDACYVQLYNPVGAYLNFVGYFHFEKAAAPAQFVVEDDNVTARDRTTVSNYWNTEVDLGWNQRDLTNILQEVVDSHSLTAVALIFRPHTSFYQKFRTTSHNNDSTLAARIFIKWTPGAAEVKLAAVIAGVATAEGFFKATRKLIGASDGVASVGGVMKTTRKIASVSAGVATAGGAIKATKKIASAIAGVASVSALLKKFRSLAAASDGVASVSAAITGTWALATSIAGVASVSAVMKPLRGLQAAIAGVATTAGAIRVTRKLASAIAGVATVAGTLSVGAEVLMQVVIVGVASVSGAIKITKRLVSVIDGVATVAGTLSVGGEILMQVAIAGAASVSSAVKATRKLASSISGEASVSAVMKTTRKLASSIAGVATVAGTLTVAAVEVLLQIVISGVAAVTAVMKPQRRLATTIVGSSVVSGAVKITKKLVTSIAGSAAVAVVLGTVEWVIKACLSAMPPTVRAKFDLGRIRSRYTLGDHQVK